MKIVTVVGTRPELIRLSVIIKKLNESVDHYVVYTNQNYDYNLSERFFEELDITPSYIFKKPPISVGGFLANAILEFEIIIRTAKPDKVLILGDTNSGLLAIIANKYGVPVYHMEAGNRCFDDRLPEESNRRIIDAISKYNLPYTENSKQNLLSEGHHKNYVFKTGNPIFEVLLENKDKINKSIILYDNGIQSVKTDLIRDYVLVTVHRAENVNDKDTLRSIVDAINLISKKIFVIISLHPHTKQKMEEFGIDFDKENVMIGEGFGLFDFVFMEQHAKCVITDSGTVPEECCIFHVPVLTVRNSTERQELVECGSNILVGTNTKTIVDAFDTVVKTKRMWYIPQDYTIKNVSDTVISLLIGK